MPFSLFSRALPRPLAAVIPPASSRHWNPGNYIAEIATDTDSLFDQIAQRLNDDVAGNYKGVMIRKTWPQLEAGMGDYTAGFKAIDDRLAQIAVLNGRRLILFIQVKTFGANTNAVPSYMRNSATYADGKNYYTTRDDVVNQGSRNGQYAYESAIGGPGGYVPNMHVAAVRERWEALMDAFATRFNGNEYLEAIVINEASVSQPIGSVGAANEVKNGVVITRPNTDGSEWVGLDTWYTNMAAAHLNMRSLLQNIQICQWINGPRPKMSTYSNQTLVEGWVPIITGHGIGLGMTDLCTNDVGFQYVPKTTPGGTYFSDHPGNIFLIQQFGQGNGIVVGHASSECFRGSVANRNQGISNNDTPVYPGPEQTRQQTQAFAKNVVGVTHLCWAHNKEDDPFHPGMTMNEVTDAFIANPLSDISTIETRPTGWDGYPAQITLNDADFYAPLTHSLIPTNGSGAPTLTRATAMWEFDNEGKLITVPASAAAFGGARMVDNFARQCSPTTSETFNAGWTYNGITAPTQNTIKVDNTTSSKFIVPVSAGTVTAGRVYCGTYRVQYVDIQYVQLLGQSVAFGSGQYCNFDLINGDYTATGCTATIEAVSAGIWDISVTMTATATTTNAIIVPAVVPSQDSTRLASFVGNNIKSVGLLRYQIHDVTGQINQTASDYVSYGILAAPYHGAGIDGLNFTTHKDGTPIPPRDLLGLATNHTAVTNTMRYCRDFTNAAWVATNVTPAKTQAGLDNAANSCSLLTATAANATILQTITAAASAGCTGWYVTRSVGTGNIYITRDGGTNWTDITSLINSDTPTLVGIENTSVLNPVVGFKWDTSGDAIIVDSGLNHLGTKIHHLPILTTSAAVTVGSQTLTYPKTSNIIDQDGTILATCTADDWTGIDGSIVGSTTHGLFATATGSSAKDGTNTPTGASDTPAGTVDIGMKYTTDFMRTMSDAGFGTATDYTGTLATDLTNIAIGAGFTGHIKDVAIWKEAINDYQMRNMT